MKDVTYRSAHLDEAELASDLMNAAYPAMTHDPVMLRYRWDHLREYRRHSTGYRGETIKASAEPRNGYGRPPRISRGLRRNWASAVF